MNFIKAIFSAIILTIPFSTFAQNPTLDEIRLFDSFFIDSARPNTTYATGTFIYSDLDFGSGTALGVRGGAPLQDRIDVGASLGYVSFDFDNTSDVSGLSSLEINARYHLEIPDSPVQASAGVLVTLPIGEEDVGGDSTDFGAFAAVRFPAQDNLVITGNFGLHSIEFANDRDLSLHLGAGTIFKLEPGIHLIGEIAMQTEEDYSTITAGADIDFEENIKLRPALAVGFDDGSADLALIAEILITLN